MPSVFLCSHQRGRQLLNPSFSREVKDTCDDHRDSDTNAVGKQDDQAEIKRSKLAEGNVAIVTRMAQSNLVGGV